MTPTLRWKRTQVDEGHTVLSPTPSIAPYMLVARGRAGGVLVGEPAGCWLVWTSTSVLTNNLRSRS